METIITNEPITNSPFRLIGNINQGYAIAIGNHRLTEPKPTKKEAIEELDHNRWNITANMIVAITETYRKIIKEDTPPINPLEHEQTK